MAITRFQKAGLLAVPVAVLIGLSSFANTGRPLGKQVSASVMRSVLTSEFGSSGDRKDAGDGILKLVNAGYELDAAPLFNEYINLSSINGKFSDLEKKVNKVIKAKTLANNARLLEYQAEKRSNKALLSLNQQTLEGIASSKKGTQESVAAAQNALSALNKKIEDLSKSEANRVKAQEQIKMNRLNKEATKVSTMDAEIQSLKAQLQVQKGLLEVSQTAVSGLLNNFRILIESAVPDSVRQDAEIQKAIAKDIGNLANRSETFEVFSKRVKNQSKRITQIENDIADLESDIRSEINVTNNVLRARNATIQRIRAEVAKSRQDLLSELSMRNRELSVMTAQASEVDGSTLEAQAAMIAIENEALAQNLEVVEEAIAQLKANNEVLR